MKLGLPSWLVSCLLALFPVEAALSQAERPPVDRVWAPETSVEMAYVSVDLGNPDYWPAPNYRDQSGIAWSPDQSRFLYVTYRGDVRTDSNVAAIHIFARHEVERALLGSQNRPPAAEAVLEFSTRSSSQPAIDDLRWDDSGAGLVFEAEDQNGTRHIYRYDIVARQLRSLVTLEPGRVEARGEFGYRNGGVVYVASRPVDRPPPAYPATWLEWTSDGSPVLLDSIWRRRQGFQTRVETAIAYCDGDRPRQIRGLSTGILNISVSPRGCQALLTTKGEADAWEYRLLDLRTGDLATVAPALNGRPSVVWSPDGRFALLMNVRGEGGTGEVDMRLYDVLARSWVTVENLRHDGRLSPNAIRWVSPRSFVANIDGGSSARVVSLVGRAWIVAPAAEGLSAPRASSSDLSVQVVQDFNTPPRVVARLGLREITISSADPALAGVRRAPWQEVSWEDPDGHMHRAALMLPVGGAHRGPPPLVINPYFYEQSGSHREFFLPDGSHKGAESAAQVLAARGFAVLWLDAWDRAPNNRAGTPDEGPVLVRRVDAIVAQLAERQLIDSSRVGIVGFSRGGYQALYYATHPGQTRIRAFIAIDNYLGSLATELWTRAALGPAPTLEPGFGGFFANRALWLRHDTLTNVDQVRAPVLFTMNLHGRYNRFADLDRTSAQVGRQTMFGSFVAARRPFDALIFPDGVHVLQRPGERIALMSAIVDWMAFWLMDETPADGERAARWTRMRTDWRRQQAWEAAGNPVASTPPADFAAQPARP